MAQTSAPISTALIAACAIVSALGGCAAPPYVAGTPIRSLTGWSPEVDHQEGSFAGKGGVRLFEQSWRPRQVPRAVIILVHGLKDHSNHYGAFAEELVRHGYAVHAFDLRGHGNSEGRRVWVDAFDDYLADLQIFIDRVRGQEAQDKVFLFGHSMGGAIVTLYTITKKADLRGLILSAPALKVGEDLNGFLVAMTKALAAIAPSAAVLDLKNRSFSRDPAVVAGMDSDPLIYNKKGPARTAAELLRAMGRIQDSMAQLTEPVLILHGTADMITNPEGSRDLRRLSKSRDKTLNLYQGLYHDLLHEPEKQKVIADIVAWMEER